MSANWQEFIDGIKDESFALMKDELKNLIKTTKTDSSEFAKKTGEKMERYLIQLAAKKITKKQFEGYMKDIDLLAKMEVRKNKVETKAAAQRIEDGVKSLIINGLMKFI